MPAGKLLPIAWLGKLYYSFILRMAFKEWAVVVDALGHGGQIIILRKGGIHEGRGGFQVEHSAFWLFPTLFHQQRESVIPTAQARFDQIAPNFLNGDRLQLQFFAELAAWQQLDSLEAAQRLRGQHIWRDEVVAERFEWGKAKNIYAMAVRVFRLPRPIQLPMRSAYAGCKSWIELETELPALGAQPVLSEMEFRDKLNLFRKSLQIQRFNDSAPI